MANSCSFMINRTITTDSMCFAGLIRTRHEVKNYVIIEEPKFIFNIFTIRKYLNELKNMGFNFTYVYQKKKKRILINTTKIIGTKLRITLFMMIRFLWEGYYRNNYGPGYDDFTQTVHHYFKLKEILPEEDNNLTLMCIAANCYIKGSVKGFNQNHFLSYSSSCNLLESLDIIKNNVNETFTNKNITIIKSHNLVNALNWKNEDYINLLKEINYDKT